MLSKSFLLYSFLLTVACVVAFTPIAHAQSPDEELEREAQTIDRMIMCPVCPAETIDQAQVEISFQMRAVVREMLAEGSSRQEILDFFVDRYGADILAAPPKSGVNLLAWILPIVGVAAGLGGLFLVIRAMTGRGRSPREAASADAPEAEGASSTAANPELAPYLEIVDRLLSSRRAAFAGEIRNATPHREPGVEPASGLTSGLDSSGLDSSGPDSSGPDQDEPEGSVSNG